jgi:hypothetical protein
MAETLTPAADPAYNPADPVTRQQPIENPDDGKLSVVYHPAPGDPKTVEAYGTTFKAGEAKEIPPEYRKKVAGNPMFEIEGQKTFGDEQRAATEQEADIEDEDDNLTFEENVIANRMEEYGTADPVAADEMRRQGETSFDRNLTPRRRGRPSKDRLREEAKARAEEHDAEMADIKSEQNDDANAEAERQAQINAERAEQAGSDPRRLGDKAAAPFALRRAPGLKSWGTSAKTGFRGALLVGSTLYEAFSGSVVTHASGGGAASVLTGTLLGTDSVFWARNNAATPDVVVVSPANGAFVVAAGAVSAYPDVDVGAPSSVCGVRNFFVFGYDSGDMRTSGLNSTSINTLDRATASTKADVLYRVIPNGDSGVLSAGSNTIEFWSINNETTGFPFSFVTAIPRGIIGRYAIAGHEDGFGSLSKFFVGDDSCVYELQGYTPAKISPPDLDRLIAAVSDKETIVVSVFVAGGHHFVVVTCPDWTWVYDTNLQRWHERISYQKACWRGLMPISAFGKWLCGDTDSGNILEISGSEQSELTLPLRAIVETGPHGAFPHGTIVGPLNLLASVGVGNATGTPIEFSPVMDIYMSNDNGISWGSPWQRPLGQQAKGLQKVEVNNMGHCGPHGVKFRFAVSDPVHVAIMGGDFDVSARAK